MKDDKPIRSFKDLKVYRNSYSAMLRVHKKILPCLPSHEKFDLLDQLSRSTKSIPRLIAEGYAKRHQKAGFNKYIDDAMGECNETVVSLEQAKDLYLPNDAINEVEELITLYDITGRQLYRLSESWRKFKKND